MYNSTEGLNLLTLELFIKGLIPVLIKYTIISAILFWLVNHYDFYREVGNYIIISLFFGILCIQAYKVYRISRFASAFKNLDAPFKTIAKNPVTIKKEEFNFYKKVFKALDYLYMKMPIDVKTNGGAHYWDLCRSISKIMPKLNEDIRWFFVEKVSKLKYGVTIDVIISSHIEEINLEDLFKMKELYFNQRSGELLVEEIISLILLLDSSNNSKKENLELEVFRLYKKELPDFIDLISSNEKMDKRILNKLMIESELLTTDKNIKKVVKI